MQKSMKRRDFAKAVAAGAVVVPLNEGGIAEKAEAQEKTESDESPRAEVDLLMELVKQRYSLDELTEEELDAIRGRLKGKLANSRQLGEFALENSQEPAFVYPVFRRTGG